MFHKKTASRESVFLFVFLVKMSTLKKITSSKTTLMTKSKRLSCHAIWTLICENPEARTAIQNTALKFFHDAPDQVDERTQEVLEKVLDLLKEKKFIYNPKTLKGFLKVTTRRHCIDYFRKKNYEVSTENDTLRHFIADPPVAHEEIFFNKKPLPDPAKILKKAIRALPRNQRIVLHLRFFKNYPYKKIATMLAIPKGTAIGHMHKAKQTLKQSLPPDFLKKYLEFFICF